MRPLGLLSRVAIAAAILIATTNFNVFDVTGPIGGGGSSPPVGCTQDGFDFTKDCNAVYYVVFF